MADVIYKKGQSSNLDNVQIKEGQILVTEDTGEMYIDVTNSDRKKINPQSDWQQNDETANDYVKNRPGGYDVLTEILPETTLNFTNSTSLTLTDCPLIEVGKKYTVTFYHPNSDNTEYELIGKNDSMDFGIIYIGNVKYTWGGTDTGEPFIIYNSASSTEPVIYISSSETLPCTYNIKIKAVAPIKIDEKYIDIKNTNIVNGSKIGSLRTIGSSNENSEYKIGNYALAEGQGTKASGDYSHAEGIGTTASGSNSHAEGIGTTASGSNSHAEGIGTTASGSDSHAEGNSTHRFSSIVTATNPTDNDIITAWNSKQFSLAKGNSAHVEGNNNLALDDYSHAEGNNTIALGYSSHAEGSYTKASGGSSHAEGGYTTASGGSSHAEGGSTIASGYSSHAEGIGTTALGDYSHAEGQGTKASGSNSHAEGIGTTASGSNSHAEGYETKAGQMGFKVTACEKLTDTTGTYTLTSVTRLYKNQRYSVHLSSSKEDCGTITAVDTTNKRITVDGYPDIALGSGITNYLTIVNKPELGDIIISGNNSHAEGYYTTALGDYQHVQGKYNIEDSNNTYADIIGNGSYNLATDIVTRSNAYTLDWNGNAWYAGAVSSKAADYAEFFEWLDGNPDNEDRVGYLVTLDGEKIRFANPGDEILGIISANPAILGDNYECDWNGKYLTDEFGRILYDKVEEFIDIPKVDEETGEATIEKKSLGFFDHPRINPDYDPDQEYINRRNRSEWAMVGMLGKLFVRDDGTAQINGYVSAGEGGIATASTEKTNMRVLSRVNDHIVKVFLK